MDKLKKNANDKIEAIVILALCAITILFDMVEITYTQDALHNAHISKIVQLGIDTFTACLLLRRIGAKIFCMPEKWLYLIPCLIVAVDNFQWSSFLNGNMELVRTQPIDFILFGAYCLVVGCFEELLFRGVVFNVVASRFEKNNRGIWKTVIISSLLFALAHLLNGISFATILQVGYTFLTGGLFAFVLLKTKNLFCCAFVHALYNFCGLLFTKPENMGLGGGVVFDSGTALTMLIIGVLAGIFVLYSISKYSIEEQTELYSRLGVKMEEKE